MKKINLFFMAATATVMMTSCSEVNKSETTENTEEATQVQSAEMVNWNINIEKSNVRWEAGTAGAMVYSHFGEIKIKEGKLTSEGDIIKAGNIVIDMNTVDPQDNGYSEEHPKSDLIGHLASPEFFDASTYPIASFEVISIEGNQVKGKLTLRGITNEEVIMLDSFTENPDGTAQVVGNLNFDRQKYNVKWAHFAKDVILADNINLQFNILANKA